MILADKIINERKKAGWSQEELAEQLGVSRQAVSKWESAQSVPDLNRILQMAELFSVSTDYLLKDDMEPADAAASAPEGGSGSAFSGREARKVSMEEASSYINVVKRTAPSIAAGVSLCILSPVLLIVLSGLASENMIGVSVNAAVGIGMSVLLLLVAAGVLLFIRSDFYLKQYKYLETEPIETLYGVSGMVREKKNDFSARHTASIAVGVVICILSVLPLIIVSLVSGRAYLVVAMVGVLLVLTSIAVNLIVRSSCVMGCYNKLLQEEDYTVKNKETANALSAVASVFWLAVVGGYLAWSFLSGSWHITWIVFPLAVFVYAIINAIANAVLAARKKEE